MRHVRELAHEEVAPKARADGERDDGVHSTEASRLGGLPSVAIDRFDVVFEMRFRGGICR